jgi:DNA polymerase-3 subunit beta
MKATINTKQFANYLKAAAKIISKNSALPILEYVYIEVTETEIQLRVFDLETELNLSLSGIDLETGGTCLPFSILNQFVGSYKGNLITIEANGQTANVSGMKMQTEDSENYPSSMQFSSPNQITFSPILFAEFEIAKNFLGKDECRPQFTGAYINASEGRLQIAATDSHRLFRSDLAASELEFGIMVNKKTVTNLKTIFNLIGSIDENVIVSYSETNVCFEQGNAKLISRLIEERYPNYNAVIPKYSISETEGHRQAYFVNVNKQQLISEVKKVSIAASKSTNQVRFDIADNEIKLTCQDLDLNNYMDTIFNCELQTELQPKTKIGLNINFLLTNLAQTLSPNVTLQIQESNRAVVIQEFHRTFLQMPVMIVEAKEEAEAEVEDEIEEEVED